MPLVSRGLGAHKCANQFMRQFLANHTATENQNVHVIVLDPLMGRVRVMTQSGANPRKFVRGYRRTDAAATDQHGPLHLFAQNRRGHRFGEIRIIDRRRVARAEILHGVPHGTEIFGHFFLQWKSCMVGSDGNAHAHFPWANCAFAASTTLPVLNPNSFCSTFNGAEAPNVFIPRIAPSRPVYLAHPIVEACSTATRAVTEGGNTIARYSLLCRSNSSQDGMLTTRARIPCFVSSS